jgi:hypothetical protein
MPWGRWLGGFGDHVEGLVLVAGGGCVGDAVADTFVEAAFAGAAHARPASTPQRNIRG